MPYSLQQYVPSSSQNGEVYSSSSNAIIPSSGPHLTFLPTHLPHHGPLSFAPQHHRHHHPHHPPPSPPTSVTSSYSSSSSLSSPTLPPTSSSLSRTISPPLPPTSYSLSASITPPPRMMPYGYSNTSAGDGGRMVVRAESEDSEVYPLDLSVRSAPREDNDSVQQYSQHRPVVSRQRHPSRPAGNESRYKHHTCLTKNCSCGNCSSRAQQRLSPYSVPLVLSGGHAHSPSSSSRSPVPQRTDSPIYGRRRTPSPACYPGLLPEGSYRAGSVSNGVTAHLHHHHNQSHYLPAGLPPPPPPPPPPHLAPSPALAVHSEHSSSPSPFQILTTADTVLHGAPTVSGLFKPYQDQVDADMPASASSVGVSERQVEENSHHQNHDPRRQLLRQLQLSQQRQQQQDEEEERTYVDLDSPSQATRSAHLKQAEERSSRCPIEMHYGQTNGTETPMEVGAHPSDTRGFNRLPSSGYRENDAREEMEKRDAPRPTGPFYLKSELSQKSSNNEESHHYLRQAFLSSDLQQHRGMVKADSLSQHHLKQREQQHPQQQMINQQEQIMPEEEEARHMNQHHPHHQQPRLETATSHSKVSMAVSTTNETNGCKGADGNKTGVNAEKAQEVLEEAKLLAFLSKTTLVTLKPNGQLNKNLGNDDSGSDSNGEATAASEATSSWDHRQQGTPNMSAHNIFKDFHVVSNDESSGKLPKIDFCLSSTARGGPPSSCKGSLVAPKKICFRLVDLVGLLVEQSLRA